MARPVNADAAATRERILKSATQLFGERGAKSSIREIAKSAGVSLAMVHHYFGSKDELYGSCVDAMYVELAQLRDHLVAEVAAANRSDGSVQTGAGAKGSINQAFETAVREGFRFAREHQSAMRLMMRRVVARGALDEGRAEEFLVPFLEQASAIVSSLTGRPAHELRLPLQSLVFLNGRYAIADVEELKLVTGALTEADAVQAVADTCKRHGKVAGTFVGDVDGAVEAAEQGFQCLMYANDIFLYTRALREGVDGIRAALDSAG